VDLLHRSPRDLGKPTSLWTLALVAQVCHERGWTARVLSAEAIRLLLKRLGISWKRAKDWITSPDPAYAAKKSPRPPDRAGGAGARLGAGFCGRDVVDAAGAARRPRLVRRRATAAAAQRARRGQGGAGLLRPVAGGHRGDALALRPGAAGQPGDGGPPGLAVRAGRGGRARSPSGWPGKRPLGTAAGGCGAGSGRTTGG